MVQLLCKFQNNYYERFNLRFVNGMATVSEKQFAEMRKIDPEIWDNLVAAQHITVIPKDMKIEAPKIEKDVKMQRFDPANPVPIAETPTSVAPATSQPVPA